jgi:O-antigen/teichoic acid export membrane protein
MNSVAVLVRVLGLIAAIFAAVWVNRDARRLKLEGAVLTPGLWAVVVFLACLLGLPAYLILRRTLWRRQIAEKNQRVQDVFD